MFVLLLTFSALNCHSYWTVIFIMCDHRTENTFLKFFSDNIKSCNFPQNNTFIWLVVSFPGFSYKRENALFVHVLWQLKILITFNRNNTVLIELLNGCVQIYFLGVNKLEYLFCLTEETCVLFDKYYIFIAGCMKLLKNSRGANEVQLSNTYAQQNKLYNPLEGDRHIAKCVTQ